MVKKDVLDPVVTLARKALDPKAQGDAEVERYAMLLISNLAVAAENNSIIVKQCLETVLGFSRSRDVKCRQSAIFALDLLIILSKTCG